MNHPPRNIAIDWLNTVWSTDLPSNAKLVACNLRRYMNSQNDMAWPSNARIQGETGLSESSVRRALHLLRDDGWLVSSGPSNLGTVVYQCSFPAMSVGGVSVKGVSQRLEGGVTQTPELNNRIKQVVSKGKFAIPELSELLEYAKEKQYTNFDHESFFDFYQSKGWMVGKNKMKDWKAAVRNWNKRKSNANTTRHTKQPDNKGRLSAVDRVKAKREEDRIRQQRTDVGTVEYVN